MKEQGLSKSHLFTTEKKPARCETYVQEKVFAIDFDERAVRVGRTLNLIAGDGQTNVLHLNTLDYERWDEKTKTEDWQDIYGEGWKKLRKLRTAKDENRDFQFDVLMANPPFAGDIKETRILAKYELGKKPDGKYQTAVGRDILFIERNLSFVKPGGRLALVLPQGRFNNSSDKRIRDYMAEHCRILAVVGLHGNVFKPHTGTKTSVIFLQKWNDDATAGPLNPRLDDYPIFFATMREPSKDNSGDKIYVKRKDLAVGNDVVVETIPGMVPASEAVDRYKVSASDLDEFVLDEHEHLVVKHDLFSHSLQDGKRTPDGIAEAFIEFAKKEKLGFFSLSPFNEARYRGLLEGLEISEVMLSSVISLTNSMRMDSEFFQKDQLSVDQILNRKTTSRLFDITSKIDVGFVGSMTAHYCDVGVPLLQTKNIAPFLVDDAETVMITPVFHAALQKSQISYEDVLIARSGSFGKASIYLKHDQVNSSDIIIIRADKKEVNPYYLTAFLNSKLGVSQMIRFSSGGIQGHVNLTILEGLQIPVLSFDFQSEIENLIGNAHESIDKSKYAYLDAENLLVELLGLENQPSNCKNVSVKSFKESFASAGRLDAEYYQPRYENLLKLLRKDGLTIADVAPVRSERFQRTAGADFQYLEIGGLRGDGTVASETVAGEDAPSRASQRVRRGDIITSTVRPIRRLSAVVAAGQDGYVCSSGFVVLQPKQIAADVLLVYLRLPAICELMDLYTSASLYPAISERDLLSLPIPQIPSDVQNTIVGLVQQSFTLKAQSERLLEAAKRAVEIAIEQDEAAGMAYLARETSI